MNGLQIHIPLCVKGSISWGLSNCVKIFKVRIDEEVDMDDIGRTFLILPLIGRLQVRMTDTYNVEIRHSTKD